MAEIASAYVSLLPSTRGFGSALNRQVGPQVSRSGTSIGAGLGKSMLKGFIAIGAGIKIAQFLGDSVSEAREANAVAALTANVIKTTGGAAKISAAQVGRLADALSRKTGIDDEQIASAENLILTFKNVRREGEGLENIFGRASRAAVDLSASGFGDTAGTAKMLGKALNDPIKGLTALGRAGVTFTEAQQDQIKAMVKQGDLLGAQKTILQEVESQVKGAAQAQVTNSDKARVAMDNLKETIGQSLVPAMDFLAGVFANKIAPAITSFITDLQSGKGSASSFASAIRSSLPPILNGVKSAFNAVRNAVRDNRPQLEQLGRAIVKLVPIFAKFVGNQLKTFGQAIRVVIVVIGAAVTAFNFLRSTVQRVGTFIAGAVSYFQTLRKGVGTVVKNVIAFFTGLPSKIKGALGNAKTMLLAIGANIIRGLISGIKSMAGAAADAAIGVVKGAIDKAKGFLHMKSPSKLWAKVGEDSVQGLIDGMRAKGNAAAAAAGDVAEKMTKKVKEKVKALRDSLASVRSDFASLVEPIASNFTQGLFDFDTASAFTANLAATKVTITGLIANFKKLIGEGLNPGFLYQLFQSGGPALINSLAGLDAASAQSAGALFGDVMSLSDQLGTSVAGSTDKGAALENQTKRLEAKLDHLIDAVHHSADRTGAAVNGAATKGHKRGKR